MVFTEFLCYNILMSKLRMGIVSFNLQVIWIINYDLKYLGHN